MKILEVKNLHVNVGDKEILKGIDLDIFEGKVHVIMGPNGAGKSTLTNAIMAHPNYEVTKGENGKFNYGRFLCSKVFECRFFRWRKEEN